MVPSGIFQSPQKVSSSVAKNAVVTLGLGSDLTRAARRRRPAHGPSWGYPGIPGTDYATGRDDRNLKWGERCATGSPGGPGDYEERTSGPRIEATRLRGPDFWPPHEPTGPGRDEDPAPAGDRRACPREVVPSQGILGFCRGRSLAPSQGILGFSRGSPLAPSQGISLLSRMVADSVAVDFRGIRAGPDLRSWSGRLPAMIRKGGLAREHWSQHPI